jgi:hypothetical protein
MVRTAYTLAALSRAVWLGAGAVSIAADGSATSSTTCSGSRSTPTLPGCDAERPWGETFYRERFITNSSRVRPWYDALVFLADEKPAVS